MEDPEISAGATIATFADLCALEPKLGEMEHDIRRVVDDGT